MEMINDRIGYSDQFQDKETRDRSDQQQKWLHTVLTYLIAKA